MICEGGKSRLYLFGLEYYIDKERADEKGIAMDIQVKEVANVKHFTYDKYKVYNDTWYCFNTPDRVIQILDGAMKNHERIRVFYGDTETGRDWMEIYDTIGYVSRSCGNVKIPLLIKNSRSIGGTGILDGSIVKITIDKVIVYQQSNYRLPNMEIREASDSLKAIGYNYSTFADGKNDFNCETMKQAENHIDFLKGKRNREF